MSEREHLANRYWRNESIEWRSVSVSTFCELPNVVEMHKARGRGAFLGRKSRFHAAFHRSIRTCATYLRRAPFKTVRKYAHHLFNLHPPPLLISSSPNCVPILPLSCHLHYFYDTAFALHTRQSYSRATCPPACRTGSLSCRAPPPDSAPFSQRQGGRGIMFLEL